MDDFKAVYRIFKLLDACLDFGESSPDACRVERMGIAEDRRENLLWMMQLKDCADFVARAEWHDGISSLDALGIRMAIKGLEYLRDNLMISKVARRQGHRCGHLIAIWL